MPQMDTPFKLLVSEFALEFAAWLLNVDDADVRSIQPLNIELASGAVRADQLFRVALADGRNTLLHIEFQGRRSERPMALRMLDYISRLAQQEPDHLCSVVFYVGEGAGANDAGEHRIFCPDGGATLAWRYRVVRLWQMRAEELLALGRPVLLTLIGQTRIEEPAAVISQVVETIQHLPDATQRIRMLTALTGLMRDEEVLKMTEQLLEKMDRDLLLDTPLLRRIREEGRAEGRAEALTSEELWLDTPFLWRIRQEAQAEGMVESILHVLKLRFDPPVSRYERIQAHLETLTDPDRLREILQAAIQAGGIADVERACGLNS